uniref:Titin n=1 Tax=Cyclopterus lumpus TaxID=8103 RepID=A0A8C2ZMR1_CYCLU
MKASFANVLETEFVVTGLTEDQIYEFRIIARNSAGVSSQPSDSTGSITAKDEVDPPKIDLEAKYSQAVVVNAGETFRLEAAIAGKPVPTVHWQKEGQEIAEAARLELKNTDFTACLVVKEAIRVDGGQYTLLVKNVGGEKSVNINVKVLDRPGPPDGPISIYGVTSEKCSIAWKSPLQDGGSDVSHYIVEKRETSRLPLPEGGIFFFRVLAENEYGVGLPAKTIEPVKISEKPQPPGKVSVVDVTCSSVTLSWEKPEHDGGSRISYYEVELAPKDSETWSLCASGKALETVVTNLLKGEEYQFRVFAVNDKGKSDPRQLAQSVVAKDLVIEPSVRPQMSTYSVQVGYDLKIEVPVAGHPKPSITWTKDGAALKQTTRVNVTDSARHTTLTIKDAIREDGGMYISAFNEKGRSDPRSLAAPVTAKDVTMKPRFMLASNTYSVQNGDDLKIEIPVIGRPVPKVEWKKDGQALKETTRLNVSSALSSTKLCIKDASKEDSGKYTITATSSVGTAELEITVIILEKPGPPKGPVKIEEVSSNYVSLSWEPPEYTGGCQINNYIVEKRDTTTTAWQIVSATIARSTIKVTNLKTGIEYQFRVSAENRYGKSSSIVSSNVIAQYPFSEPAAPGTPIVSAATKENMVVEWNAPTNNGGSPVLGYHFERKEKNSLLWTKLNKLLIPDTRFKTSELEEGIEYEFRVYAENIAGLSPVSKVSVSTVARDPCDPPGNPETTLTRTILTVKDCIRVDGGHFYLKLVNVGGVKMVPVNVKVLDRPGSPDGPLEVKGVTAEKCYLHWNHPSHDGGASISHYIIEKRE